MLAPAVFPVIWQARRLQGFRAGKAAIFADPGLRALQISVDTVNDVVTLTGSVDSLPDSERTKALAGAVSDVTMVENKLVLKSN